MYCYLVQYYCCMSLCIVTLYTITAVCLYVLLPVQYHCCMSLCIITLYNITAVCLYVLLPVQYYCCMSLCIVTLYNITAVCLYVLLPCTILLLYVFLYEVVVWLTSRLTDLPISVRFAYPQIWALFGPLCNTMWSP